MGEECGCHVIPNAVGGVEIDYCPLHKSAPTLYEACLTALGVMVTLDQSKGWVKEISGVIQQALSLAEVK